MEGLELLVELESFKGWNMDFFLMTEKQVEASRRIEEMLVGFSFGDAMAALHRATAIIASRRSEQADRAIYCPKGADSL